MPDAAQTVVSQTVADPPALVCITLDREPRTYPLDAPFAGCSVTLKRLPSPVFAEAYAAAAAILKDQGRLAILLETWDLRPPGRPLRALFQDAGFMAGIGEWLGVVECACRAISDWSGFADDAGRPLPVTREALEALCLNQAFLDQVRARIDRAAVLVAAEGKG